jgi:ABC-type transport system involved in multi-copper enzyme maturation permease subunit
MTTIEATSRVGYRRRESPQAVTRTRDERPHLMVTPALRMMLATALRVISQTVLNARMLTVLLFLPSAILGLLSWVLSNAAAFEEVGSAVFAMYPVLLVTGSAAIVLLRERQSGTLERLLTLPMQRATMIAGYLLAFTVTSTVQSAVTVAFLTTVVGLTASGPAWTLVLVGTLSGALGASFGLVLGMLARTEFEAIQIYSPLNIVICLIVSCYSTFIRVIYYNLCR